MKHDSGRMTAVVSSGVLSRGGQEGRIRTGLLKDNLVDTVIALPEKMFQGTPVGGALLVMRRQRASGDVLFIDARGFATGAAGRNSFSAQGIDWLARAYASRTVKQGVSALAPIERIAEHGYSLSVSLYVRAEQESPSTDIHAIRYRRGKLRTELERVNKQIDTLLDTLISGEPRQELALEQA